MPQNKRPTAANEETQITGKSQEKIFCKQEKNRKKTLNREKKEEQKTKKKVVSRIGRRRI